MSVENTLRIGGDLPAPRGWVALSPDHFSSIVPATQLTDFFNGAEPDWRTVVNPKLPCMQLAQSALERTRRRQMESKSGIELLVGPTGEGKSTAIRQVAARLALEDSCTVLWRQEATAVVGSELIMIAESYGPGTVIVSDNAHVLLQEWNEIVMRGLVASSAGLQVILASRDTDWFRATRALGFKIDPAVAWKSKVASVSVNHPFGRVTMADALKIVRSWRTLDEAPPAAIRGISDDEAAQMLTKASEIAAGSHGAFLGGLLAVRYTPEELKAHLVTLLEALACDVTPSGGTLADVAMVLALVDLAGVDGIPSAVVAEFCGVEESQFRTEVANKLGSEAVANYADDTLRSRHPLISQVIFGLAASGGSALSMQGAARELLRSAASAGNRGTFQTGYGHILGVGRELYKAHAHDSGGEAARQLGIALARDACELMSDNLANYMALSECLRLDRQAGRSLETVWHPIAERVFDRASWQDWNKNCRTAMNEYAIAASVADAEIEAVVIRIASLSDLYSANRLELRKAGFALSGVMLHLYRIQSEAPAPAVAQVLAQTCACLVKFIPTESEYIIQATEMLESLGIAQQAFGSPADLVEQLERLVEGFVLGEIAEMNLEFSIPAIQLTGLRALLEQLSSDSDAIH